MFEFSACSGMIGMTEKVLDRRIALAHGMFIDNQERPRDRRETTDGIHPL
jgi:hypothetical protein